jgi:hypothetical protein
MPGTLKATIAYYDPPEPVPASARPDFSKLPLRARPARIEDIRGREDEFSLQCQGFCLAGAPTAVADFYDRDEVTRVYLPEVSELLREVTGCRATAMLNAPVVRVSDAAGQRRPGTTMTGDFAHADFSAPSAEFMLRRAVPPDQAQARLRQRYSIFNVWRAFSAPPQDVPLALCDARCVAPADKQLCSITLTVSTGEVMTWENLTYRHNPQHRWFYASDMTRDQAYVFRAYDSDPARAEQVPHSAFRDPSCPPGAPARASIEVRMLAFYE